MLDFEFEKRNCDLVITKPGVLAFGKGLPFDTDITTFFQDETVIHVSCGEQHSAVVCESGRVYTFGRSQIDEWVENNDHTVTGPKLVETLSTVRIAQAACGYQFTLFLSDQGELYACGVNDQGQLGLGHKDKVPTPTLVTGLPPIKKVTAGYCHTIVLTDRGEVWATGYNAKCQLGLGHTENQTSFTQVPNIHESIRDISSGAYHTALISASWVLLMTGMNDDGQLGLSGVKTLSSFKRASVPSTAVAAVACGYYHTIVLRANGKACGWGYNDNGQLGTGNYANRSTPTKMVGGLENQTISQVIAGCYHTAVLTQEGDLFMCGKGTSGELGLGMDDLSTATLIPKSSGLVVQQVAFSENYSLLLVVPSDAEVVSQLQIGITEEVDMVECVVADWERSLMKSLECPICFNIMSPPIHQCNNGHSFCRSCWSDAQTTVCPICRGQFIDVRCIALESLSTSIKLPCTDCLKRMSVCELDKHGEVCLHRKYVCPVQLHSCGWSGRPDKMLAHTSSAHPDQTWRDLPRLFLHSLSDGLLHTDLLSAHDQVFTLHRRYDQEANTFQTALKYIGPPENAHEFVLEFTFIGLLNHRSTNNTYCRNVCTDLESIEDMLRSSNCVAIENLISDSVIKKGRMVCQVAILRLGRSELADQIK